MWGLVLSLSHSSTIATSPYGDKNGPLFVTFSFTKTAASRESLFYSASRAILYVQQAKWPVDPVRV
jgi:hypothetical protein